MGYPGDRVIDVYRPDGTLMSLLNDADALDGGDVLPGFSVTLRDVFKGLW